MLEHGLSNQQLAVICALSCGASMAAAADQAGVHRNTISNWRRNLLPFQHALADAQYDRAIYFREKIEDLVDLAVKSLQDILTDAKAPASVKLKAALAVIATASTPPAPKKQVELNIETVLVQNSAPQTVNPQTVNEEPPAPTPPVHNDAQPSPSPEPPTMHNDAQSNPDISVISRPFAANPPAAHNPAQPRKRREVARNAQCPCGSGKKYKRCCLDSSVAPPLASAA